MRVRPAVLLHEARVDAQDGPPLAADAGGGHVLARLDAEELQERAEGVAAGGDGVEDAADEGVGFAGGGHRASSGKKRTSGVRVHERGLEAAGRQVERPRAAREDGEGRGRREERAGRRRRRPRRGRGRCGRGRRPSGAPARGAAPGPRPADARRRVRAGASPTEARMSQAARHPRRPSRSRSDTRARPACDGRATRKRRPGWTARATTIREVDGTDMLWSSSVIPRDSDPVVPSDSALSFRGTPAGRVPRNPPGLRTPRRPTRSRSSG